MIYQIDTRVWASPKQYAAERGVTKQVVHWWMSNGQLEVKELVEYGLKLIKRGSEKGSAKPDASDTATSDTKSTKRVIRRRNRNHMKQAANA